MTDVSGVPIVVASPMPKPGYRTTEFWLSKAAMLLSILFAADVIPTSGPAAKIAAIAAMALISQGYAVSRSLVKMSVVLVVVALAGSQPACSSTSKRDRTLHAALAALDSASATFVAFDLKHQRDIVTEATDPAGGTAALNQWYVRRGPVEGAFAIAYRAVAIAALANDAPPLQAAVEAAAIVVSELRELGAAP